MEQNIQTGKRIQQRREELGLNLGDIAKEVGVAVSTIQRYEKGKIEKIKLPVIEAIAKALQVDPAWLLCQTDRMTVSSVEVSSISNLIPLPQTYRIPLVGEIACGSPILAEENVEEILEIPQHIKADFALRCHGDSMIGVHIHDGDIVYIRQQPDVDNGSIAAVCIENSATLKRVYKYPDKLVLSPANPQYEPLVYTGDELSQVRILGKAVGFISLIH
ncbi:MAG: LexA family transcriptional regulator [Negativibacillus sp.]|nr:LexA family transcriptional regulator [Negativibacillus sp.]